MPKQTTPKGSERRRSIAPKRRVKVEVGSGNVFADLELPDADALLLKSQIAAELHRLIKSQRLTQINAAKRMGIGQPDLSNILRGRFRGFSAERLMRMLTVFNSDVDIVVRPHRAAGKRGRITFTPAAA
jgi:predicted XRE-type DNA-binding protein